MARLTLLEPGPRPALAWLVAAVALGGACKSAADGVSEAPEASARGSIGAGSGVAAAVSRVRLVSAPTEGSVDAIVREAQNESSAERRTLVVYVGAAWCEPCQRFHRAAERGELDSLLPSVTLLEFDLDRDRGRLASAGYASDYIPLFALPTVTGVASGKRVEGGIKGDGAVGFIVPRLRAMLSE